VYQHLRAEILQVRLKPGTVLGEVDIAAELDVSRTPVRTALQMLLAEQLVEIGPRRQVLVRGFSARELEEVCLLRHALERIVVETACRVIEPDEIDQLRLTLLRQKRAAAAKNTAAFMDLDDAFHLGLAAAARLPLLSRFLQQLRAYVRMMGLQALTREGRFSQVLEEHQAVVDALEARKVNRARAAIDSHLKSTQAVLRQIDFLPAVDT
jgi:DNA-binding GntR family transcriptional regulator